MKAITLKVHETCPEGWSDWNSALSSARNSSKVLAVDVLCKSEDENINLLLRIYAEANADEIVAQRDESLVASAASSALSEASKWISLQSFIDIYQPLVVDVRGRLQVPIQEEIEVTVNEGMIDTLEKATYRQKEAESSFKQAKALLSSGSDAFVYRSHEASRAASFIYACIQADALFLMDRWNAEKSPRVPRLVEELIGRKNVDHPNYRNAMDSLHAVLYSVRCPEVWNACPPLL